MRTTWKTFAVLGKFLAHGSNAAICVALLAFAGAAALGRLTVIPVALGIGVLLFFSTEYTTHRFVLHARPARHQFLLGLQHRLHYDHHAEPERLDLLFLPLWFLIPVQALFAAAYFAITRSIVVTESLVAGNLLGVLYYEWVHYVAHIPLRPVTRFGRWIKKYHLWHHFKSERYWFGVTNPAFDVLHRTFIPVEAAARSGSTRVLH